MKESGYVKRHSHEEYLGHNKTHSNAIRVRLGAAKWP